MILRNNFMMGMVGSGKLIPPEIGHFWEGQGGFYIGMLKYPTGEVYAILVSDKTQGGHGEGLIFKTTNSGPVRGTSDYDGFDNTQQLLPFIGEYPAAEFCVNYEGYGINDWYLPSPYELNLAYRVFKLDTQLNVTEANTANSYVFPSPLPQFTTTSPPITSFMDWRIGGSQALNNGSQTNSFCWTSEEDSTQLVTIFRMNTGHIQNTYKTNDLAFYVTRPFRRVRLKHLEN